ncbi:CDC73-domain-containing protein [Dendrothele bispora CBS 962.96]|uniref:CDC73-domain-containing protein n=1 Tax=Dendrothele bispora (strain CBS 962.96) TaxID=1314807 RepID=A0A4S8MVP4_DENBC|nr:CDC73-domain-containing protein [Dendrothele bispora CBS 962.96]
MSSADALLSLRSAIQSKASISFAAADGSPTQNLSSAILIVLPSSQSFPKTTPTRLRKGSNEYYALEAVYLAWLLRNATSAEYMKQVRDNGVSTGFVSVTERKGVVDWLEGNVDDLPGRIASALPSSTSSAASVGAPKESASTTTPPSTPPRSSSSLHSGPQHQQKSSTSAALASSASGVSASIASVSPQKRRYVPDTADTEVVKKIKQQEVELRDRNTVLRGVKHNNFSSVSQVYAEKLKKLRESSRPGAAVPVPATPTPDPKMQARKARNMYPIIMISSSPTALITMHNVKRFLQESTFETSQSAKARAAAEGNTRPDDLIPLYRRLTAIDSSGKETIGQTKYFIVDSVEALSKFGADAWDRVVCVMTTGQAWQFRPYKWSEPRVLFHHVKGVHVSWANDPPNPKIKDWNVTELKIDQHRRHVDKSTVAHFWKILDDWTLANKPWLMKT